MVPFIIYWFALLVGIGWFVWSTFWSLFYSSRKENGNLWALGFFNLICLIVLVVIFAIYKAGQGFGITTYSSYYYVEFILLALGIVFDLIVGRTLPEK